MDQGGEYRWVTVPYFEAAFEEGDVVELDEPQGVLHRLTITNQAIHCPACQVDQVTAPTEQETECRCACGWVAIYMGVLPPGRRPATTGQP